MSQWLSCVNNTHELLCSRECAKNNLQSQQSPTSLREHKNANKALATLHKIAQKVNLAMDQAD